MNSHEKSKFLCNTPYYRALSPEQQMPGSATEPGPFAGLKVYDPITD